MYTLHQPTKTMRMLIVEDDPFRAAILTRQLKNLGYEDITGVTSGGEASRFIRTQTFDLIITDWRMHGLSAGHTPIIMFVPKGLPEDVLAARMTGVDDYIIKPASLEVLGATIAKVFKEAGHG